MRIKLSAVFSSVKFYGVVAVLATSVAVAYWLRTTHVQVPDYAGNSVTIYPRSIFNREVVDVRSGKRVRLVPDRRPVLLVLLSGTECPSCLDENAVWERLAEYREQLRVIGVFTGTTTEDVDAYVRMRRPTFEMYRLSGRDPLSQEYAGDQVTQYVNGDHAYVQGVELAYQQHLSYLPGVLKGAQMNANFTYTGSRNYKLTGRTDNPALVGQAPVSWNVGPSYATKCSLVTIGVSHNGANIYAYQYLSTGPGAVPFGVAGPNGDNYFFAHTQVDAKASYYLGKGFTALAIGENMNNAVFGFYNGSQQYMVQREYYKPTYSGGIRWTRSHE